MEGTDIWGYETQQKTQTTFHPRKIRVNKVNDKNLKIWKVYILLFNPGIVPYFEGLPCVL